MLRAQRMSAFQFLIQEMRLWCGSLIFDDYLQQFLEDLVEYVLVCSLGVYFHVPL